MNQLKRFLSFHVWTPAQTVVLAFAVVIWLFACFQLGVSFNLAGAFGAFVLAHLGMHGWTFLEGTWGQRVLLALVWFCAIVVGGVLSVILGF